MKRMSLLIGGQTEVIMGVNTSLQDLHKAAHFVGFFFL